MARILVVDDDPMICEALELFLSSDGHQVVTAPEGETALARVGRSPVDIAIVDILMPVKEGFETIRDLRRVRPELCVIAMSGGSMNRKTDFLTMAVKLGADKALPKPVESQVLRRTIDNCLGPFKRDWCPAATDLS